MTVSRQALAAGMSCILILAALSTLLIVERGAEPSNIWPNSGVSQDDEEAARASQVTAEPRIHLRESAPNARKSGSLTVRFLPKHALPTRVAVEESEELLDALNVGDNTWRIPPRPPSQGDWKLVAEFGPGASIELTAPTRNEVVVTVPPLAPVEVGLQAGPSEQRWMCFLEPMVGGNIVSNLRQELFADGATAAFLSRTVNFRDLETSERVRIRSIQGSSWSVGVTFSGHEVEPRYSQVVCPGSVIAVPRVSLPTIRVTGLPEGAAVALHYRRDRRESFGGPPTVWVDSVGAGGIVTWDRLGGGRPVPPMQEFQVAVLLPDTGSIRKTFKTDASGHAAVTCNDEIMSEPWIVATGPGKTISVLHIRHGDSWFTVPSMISDVGGTWVDYWRPLEAEGLIGISTVDLNWGVAYIVTDRGEVARVTQSDGPQPIQPMWLSSQPASIDARSLGEASGTIAWVLSFREEAGEWLTIMRGRGSAQELDRTRVTELLGVETRLWVRQLGGGEDAIILSDPYYRR